MKYCVIVCDGMADLPVAELQNMTPLQAAVTPAMDSLAGDGRVGLVRTVPRGMSPDSDVAMMSVMGYDPRKYHSGRAPIEALGAGLKLSADRVYFRCNLVTLDEDVMADHSGGHIAGKEAEALIKLLNEQAAPQGIRFHTGAGYRCFLSCDHGLVGDVQTVSPQNILGRPINDQFPTGEGAELLRGIMEKSRELFAEHDINKVRADLGENPVSMIWLWGGGRPQGDRPAMPPFEERFGKKGAAVAAVPLVRGLAMAVGWAAPKVRGATGYADTDYSSKARTAIRLLRDADIVLVHVEAPDEASHSGNIRQKVQCIESIDSLIVGPLLDAFKKMAEGRILLLPDHISSVEQRRHLDSPVPFAIHGTGVESLRSLTFNETAASEADLKVEDGHELMAYFLRQ
jgi:2,3-bisphosphoglycerate-independent phosphoglycerate mutase